MKNNKMNFDVGCAICGDADTSKSDYGLKLIADWIKYDIEVEGEIFDLIHLKLEDYAKEFPRRLICFNCFCVLKRFFHM